MDSAIIFVTDKGFLVPSLVVCSQLLEQSIDAIADILIYTIDIEQPLQEQLKKEFPWIRFIPLLSKSFLPQDNTYFHKNHVPAASLARLVLSDIIPVQYENLVYLDGDLQITGDIKPLITYRVPDGKVAAGNGSLWLKTDASDSKYLQDLGNVPADRYFNAGVIAFRRDTWCDLAPKALQYFFDHSKECRTHDQSALNAVCNGKTVELSPAYNFHSIYANAFCQLYYKPRIIHFTGPNKPWKYSGPPWGRRFMRSYTYFLQQHPFLKDFITLEEKPLTMREFLLRYVKHIHDNVRYPRTFYRKHKRFAARIARKAFAF